MACAGTYLGGCCGPDIDPTLRFKSVSVFVDRFGFMGFYVPPNTGCGGDGAPTSMYGTMRVQGSFKVPPGGERCWTDLSWDSSSSVNSESGAVTFTNDPSQQILAAIAPCGTHLANVFYTTQRSRALTRVVHDIREVSGTAPVGEIILTLTGEKFYPASLAEPLLPGLSTDDIPFGRGRLYDEHGGFSEQIASATAYSGSGWGFLSFANSGFPGISGAALQRWRWIASKTRAYFPARACIRGTSDLGTQVRCEAPIGMPIPNATSGVLIEPPPLTRTRHETCAGISTSAAAHFEGRIPAPPACCVFPPLPP